MKFQCVCLCKRVIMVNVILSQKQLSCYNIRTPVHLLVSVFWQACIISYMEFHLFIPALKIETKIFSSEIS